MSRGMKKLIRQAKFREDGTVTDVPARDSEKPQLEKQKTLFDWQGTEELLKRLKESHPEQCGVYNDGA